MNHEIRRCSSDEVSCESGDNDNNALHEHDAAQAVDTFSVESSKVDMRKTNNFLHRRGIKGKHGRGRKLKFTNIKKIGRYKKHAVESRPDAHAQQDNYTEAIECSTRSSVCSESQPLPTNNGDMDWDIVENNVIDLGPGKGMKR